MRKKIIIIFFVALIGSPLPGWIFGFRSELNENRVLAKMPDSTVMNLLNSKFYSELGSFHDDRFPYRGLLIKTKNSIDFHLFDVNPSSAKVYIGKDGWLFYTPSINDYLKDSCYAAEEMRQLAKKLHELERSLESSGRELIVVIAPNKATIYPEHVGLKLAESSCGKSRYDLFLEALNEFPVHGFVRVDRLLAEEKSKQRVYEITGTHWNIYGAMVTAKAILRKFSPSLGNYLPDIEVALRNKGSDLNEMLPMFIPMAKKQSYVVTGFSYNSKVTEEKKPPLNNGRPRLKISAAPEGNDRILPKMLMYRDSFMTLPIKVLEGAFEQIDALWTVNVPSENLVEREAFQEAKIVLIEVVERDLGALNIDIERFVSADSTRQSMGSLQKPAVH